MPKRKTVKRRAVKKSKNRLFLPYPLIFLLLIAAGVFLVAWSLRANAQDLLIQAIVKGQPITQPAVITEPVNGAHFTAVPVTISGTCPANAAYVEIFRTNFMSGSAQCLAGKFELPIDLFAGRNDLTAHSFNVTDDEGPVSAVVTIYYDQQQPAAGPGTSNLSGPGSSSPSNRIIKASKNSLTLKTAFVYKGYYVGQKVEWPVEINGGEAPYALNVDWGDANNSIVSRKDAGQFYITHTYKKAGPNKGGYNIKIQTSDYKANYTYMQFFVLVNAKNTTPSAAANIYSKPPPSLGGLRSWLWVAWPAYVSVFLMVVGYKLGERQELLILQKRGG